MRTILISALAMLWPAMALADCGECAKPCEKPKCCAPCPKKVKCCEKVAICCPVEKKHCRLVKTECCVPKVHTKCVKDSCDPCAPARQITWTTYHKKTSCHWETYTTTEMKTKYVKRCTEHLECPSCGSASAASPAASVTLAN